VLSETQIERYSRQIILPQVGGRGQTRLLSGVLTIWGSGDLAATAGRYLAAAGVGYLRVSSSTAALIDGVNPDCHVVALEADARAQTVDGAAAVLCAGADRATCARIGAACVAAGVPWMVGDATGTVGWMYSCDGVDASCYGCVAQAVGHAGRGCGPLEQVTAGFIGTLLATEAMKVMLNLRSATVGRRIVFDAPSGDVRDAPVLKDPCCTVCGSAG